MSIPSGPACPDCKEPMERGYVLDLGHLNARATSKWVPGEPTKSFWSGLKAESRMEIEAYRCPRCGLLRQYAP